MYLRVNWKDVQQRAGRLDFCEHWKLTFELAKRYQKRIGFRVMKLAECPEGRSKASSIIRDEK